MARVVVSSEATRARMVEQQLRRRDIHDPRVLQAFANVPREEFVRAGHPRAGVRRRAGAPHEAICVAAGAPAPPPSLLDQLAIGGRLVLPRGGADHQRLVRIVRQGERTFAEEDLRDVRFVLLVGAEGWPELGELGERKPPAQA
jgi:protein-L-isoaspartate(D-aspartate) O-methyltransferase